MATQSYLLLSFLIVLGQVSGNAATITTSNISSFNRHSFPADFLFGTASASYQYEGAAAEGGRGPSVWDTFTHRYPEKIKDHSNGDVAVDQYHRYKEDIGIMKEMGLDAYRFSISWSRILPKGKLSGGVNREGVAYYNNLTNELLANGIKPFVTLFHWDLPQTLEDEYGGFLNHEVVNDYRDFAEICFKEFGDRVKHWITFNEPYIYCTGGYANGGLAPGRCSAWQQQNCTGGNSATEPYIVAHNLLLAHANALKLYKKKYQATQKGIIGITLNSDWFIPFSNAKHNKNAAIRAIDFMFGWFMDPLTFGDYPHTMKFLVGKRLPKFSAKQSKMLKGSYDFLGLNYYTSRYAYYLPRSNILHESYITDALVNFTSERNGVPIGPKTVANWIHIYPRGIRKLLLYTKRKYNHPLIYVTENGVPEFNNATLTLKEALMDNIRVYYYDRHLSFLQKAIKDGVNVKGYFPWSLLDNFGFSLGYTLRFGINYIDYNDGLKRYPKLSAHWFKNFLKK